MSIMASFLLVVIYLAFISLGLPDSLLGSAWPAIYPALEVPVSWAGILSMIVSCGTILSSLFSERLIHRFSTRIVTTVSVFLTAAALFGYSVSRSFGMLCLFAVPYGLGAGAIDSALNNYVALHYSSRHMSWLHSFWGVGTIISPYIMSFALTHRGWQSGYRLVSYIQLGITLVLLLTLPLWKAHKTENPKEEKSAPLGLRGALKIPGVPGLLLGFFSYCAAESTANLWLCTYLVSRGAPESTAAVLGSLFFVGITLGRFLSGFITERLGDWRMILFGVITALTGVFLIALPGEAMWLPAVGILVFGLGCAPVYPAIIHSTPSLFGKERSQGIIGIQMAVAYVGSTLMPPLFGVLARRIGARWLPLYILPLLGLLLWMMIQTFGKKKKPVA